jgi:hypothetical protein
MTIRPTPRCPEPTPEHAYFETLRALNLSTWDHDGTGAYEHVWSLRDPDQLIAVSLNPREEEPHNPFWTYALEADTDPEAQDAAKFTLDPADIELYNPGQSDADPPRPFTLTFPIGVPFASTDTLLVTWDAYYTDLWSENMGTVDSWKHYQLYRGKSVRDRNTYVGPKVHFGKRHDGGIDSGAQSAGTLGLSLIPANPNDEKGPFPVAGHIYDRAPDTDPPRNTGEGGIVTGALHPESGRYHVHRSCWHRYWLEIHMSVRGFDDRFDSWRRTPQYLAASEAHRVAFETGTWTLVNVWFADERRGPMRVLYGVPWRIEFVKETLMVSQFGFEMDTSGAYNNVSGGNAHYMKGAQTGVAVRGYPCVGYWRNVLALRNYASPGHAFGVGEEDALIFQRPETE